jgi:UDP-N-acetylmuramyl pentapeptide phosphotransferase/UDP-N-acetylglucosamine-1-phosphate transferase
MPPVEFALLWSMALLLGAAVLTEGCILYARWRGLADAAGPRRSHTGVVARGGGLAVVLAMFGACTLLVGGGWMEQAWLLRFAAGLALVSAIGWIDDHRPQPVLRRLAVHFSAAALIAWPAFDSMPGLAGMIAFAVAMLLVAGAVNFWNFMDGIDGIASLQAVFVAGVLVHAFAASGDAGAMLLSLALAVACLGFLPFNFPRARIFLGDVGSGGIGFAIAALLLHAVQSGGLDVWTALLLPLAFWLDAGLTLAARMVLGRRWYTAHREHLYQWLVRRGRSHAQVDALFLGWNLLIVLPLYLLVAHRLLPSFIAFAAAAVLGALGWWQARRLLLRQAREYGWG